MYGEVLGMREEAINKQREFNLARIYLNEAISRGSEILMFARRFSKLNEMLQDKDTDEEALNEEIGKLRSSARRFFKNYHMPLDRELLGTMLTTYYENVPAHQQPAIMAGISKKHKGNFQAYADKVFSKSIFTSLEDVNAFLDKPRSKTITKDRQPNWQKHS